MNSGELTYTNSGQPTAGHAVVDGVAMTTRHAPQPSPRPPVVLVHGGMHGAWMWADAQEWLSDRGWDSVAVDLLSHGRSRALPTEQWLTRSLLDSAFEIDVACQSVAGNPLPPVVMAWSMGGLAALAHAAGRRQPLTAVVLLCPVVPTQFGGAEIPIPVNPDEPVDPFPADVAHRLFYDGMSADKAAAFSKQLQAESPRAVLEATRWTAELDVSGIEAPTLAIGAENDELIPPAYVQSLAAAIPGASYIHLRGTGHGVPVNPGWEFLMSTVTSWLSLVATGDGPDAGISR
ncbi:MAG TPA: alpha/beta hydrolase [Streptosporangiaceae bacterium]